MADVNGVSGVNDKSLIYGADFTKAQIEEGNDTRYISLEQLFKFLNLNRAKSNQPAMTRPEFADLVKQLKVEKNDDGWKALSEQLYGTEDYFLALKKLNGLEDPAEARAGMTPLNEKGSAPGIGFIYFYKWTKMNIRWGMNNIARTFGSDSYPQLYINIINPAVVSKVEAPAKPQNLLAPTGFSTSEPAAANSVTLNWNKVDCASKYVISYTKDSGKNWEIANSETTSCLIDELTAGTQYSAVIKASNCDRDGNLSETITFTTASAPAAPAAPAQKLTSLATPALSTTSTADSITVGWYVNPQAKAYDVVVGKGKPIRIKSTSYTKSGLKPETTYTVKVRAIGDGKKTSNSGWVIGKVKTGKKEEAPKVIRDTNTDGVSGGARVGEQPPVVKEKPKYRTNVQHGF